MTAPDPIDAAATGDWPEFMQTLIDRVTAARERNEPVRMSQAEIDDLNRRTDTGRVAPFAGDGPFTLLGWPVTVTP